MVLNWYYGAQSLSREYSSHYYTTNWTTDTGQTRPSNQIGIFTQRTGANRILTISINLRDGYVGKSLQISRFWNTQTSMFGTNNLHSKGTDIVFLPYSWFELEQVVWTLSACLNALSCNRVIIWLDIWVNKQLKRCTTWPRSMWPHCGSQAFRFFV